MFCKATLGAEWRVTGPSGIYNITNNRECLVLKDSGSVCLQVRTMTNSEEGWEKYLWMCIIRTFDLQQAPPSTSNNWWEEKWEEWVEVVVLVIVIILTYLSTLASSFLPTTLQLNYSDATIQICIFTGNDKMDLLGGSKEIIMEIRGRWKNRDITMLVVLYQWIIIKWQLQELFSFAPDYDPFPAAQKVVVIITRVELGHQMKSISICLTSSCLVIRT